MEIKQVVEVHNVWTIYGLNQDGTESAEKVAEFRRPQDWGHPRWHYHLAKVEYERGDTCFINHCHCWTDVKRKAHEYLSMFSGLAFQAMQPGYRREVCAPEYLQEDDFWSDEWDMSRWEGRMPPYFDEPEEQDFAGIESKPNQYWNEQLRAYLVLAYLHYKGYVGDEGVLLEREDVSIADLMRWNEEQLLGGQQ